MVAKDIPIRSLSQGDATIWFTRYHKFYIHTKWKVVNELSKRCHYWQLFLPIKAHYSHYKIISKDSSKTSTRWHHSSIVLFWISPAVRFICGNVQSSEMVVGSESLWILFQFWHPYGKIDSPQLSISNRDSSSTLISSVFLYIWQNLYEIDDNLVHYSHLGPLQ